jgi:hypothetical protein
MSFIDDHAAIDVSHNKLMRGYLEQLVLTNTDFDSVSYCMRATAHYYSEMISGAIRRVDDPVDWGVAHEELTTSAFPAGRAQSESVR